MSESKEIKRSVFFISDGTAITAETLGHSLLAQFPNVDFDIHIHPYITSEEAAMNVVAEINARAQIDGQLPLVFDTLVDQDVRDIINTAKAICEINPNLKKLVTVKQQKNPKNILTSRRLKSSLWTWIILAMTLIPMSITIQLKIEKNRWKNSRRIF